MPDQLYLRLEHISALEVGFPLAPACRLHERVKQSNAGFCIEFLKSIVYFNKFRPPAGTDKRATKERRQLSGL
ncbi:MAG: hypothetical protein KME19_09045 [Microcoleus vaginatus WJT46-NPBG5]|nr:hypothetical protein [Microcoleus vaginatus WJT46-NPBG5]